MTTTPSQTVGPFFGFALPYELGPRVFDPSDADAIRIAGVVTDGSGDPVPDALIELWQASAAGRYEDGFDGFGRCPTGDDGRFAFVTVKPGRVPAPGGGTQAPHIAVSVFARGLLKRLVTRIYFPDEEEANAADPVLALVEDPGLRATLIAVPDGARSLRFDIGLQGDRQTAFFDV